MTPAGRTGTPRPATSLSCAAYEPIVRYNDGELFFPTDVEAYLAACDLLVGSSERDRDIIVPVGELTAAKLAEMRAPPGETLYLRLVQQPLAPIELARWRSRPDRRAFQAPGRLARVGLFARLVDAGVHRLPAAPRHGARAVRQRRHRSSTRPPWSATHATSITVGSSVASGWIAAPVPVLLLHERLPLHVPGRERPRGGLGAGVRLPR